MRLPPKNCAGNRSEESGEWASKTDCSLSLKRHPQSLPSHVSSETRKKHRHIGRQSAPLDVKVMSHFMNQNEDGEADAELGAECCPVETEECHEAEKKFQFENRTQQELAL